MNRSIVIGSTLVLVLAAFAVGRYSGRSGGKEPLATKRVQYYVDPMHPSYRSDKPGIAPDCGMALMPVYEGEDVGAKLQLPPGAVRVGPETQQLVGVRAEAVEKNSGTRMIRTTGRVEADETRVHRVMAGTEGWVRSLENNPPGTVVKQNELLATVYSKEFRNAEQAYISSVTSLDRMKTGRDQPADPNKMGDASMRINEEQLRALGMGELQIKDLAKNRQITRDVTISSPIDGIVLVRTIAPGERFENGSEFYRIADLSKVWILADLYGEEAKAVTAGTRVKVTVREMSRTLYARVSQSPPLFDPESRTLKLRLEADNPGFLLRPDMFVDLEFSGKAPAGLSVPQEAILDSGTKKIVYVESSEGVFEPREVQIGTAFGNRITIAHGLKEGDRVVTSGNFLVDSESRMRSSALAAAAPTDQTARAMDRDIDPERDPVCGMSINPGKSTAEGRQENYKRQVFMFCSEKCQRAFHGDPAKYAGVKITSTASSARALSRDHD